MKRLTPIFAALLLAPFLLSPICAQVKGSLAGAISQLLDYPAPPPPPPKELVETLAAMRATADPGEDAPIKVLIDYWRTQAAEETGKQPSEKVRQRLLQACEEEPEFPPGLFDFLPNTPDAHARLKRILDEEQTAGSDALASSRQKSRRDLREWLMCNSEYLRDELIREASNAKDDGSDVKGSQQLAALAGLDWRTAESLLKNYAAGAAPLTTAFALSLLYGHAAQNNQSAEVGSYRDRLKRIAGDPQSLNEARVMVVGALMKTDWQGRDEWFLSLFADRTLLRVTSLDGSIDALAEPVKRDPDRWIPALSRLIGHSDRNIHNAAALCLAQFIDHPARKGARKDALLPLLPWLSDPQWAVGLNDYNRGQLAESMGRLKIREALPGLIWMIKNEETYIRSHAADALAEMRDGSVVPILREAIRAGEKGADDYSPFSLTRALIACGGLTIQETVAALESCAEKAEVSVEDDLGDRRLSVGSQSQSFDIWVGQIVAQHEEYAPEALAAAVIERLKTLRAEKPDIAAKLWLIAQQWRFPAVDVAIVGRIADGSANLDALLVACKRRQDLRANADAALRELAGAGGYQAGVGAALLGDQSIALEILNGDDRAAKLALLACARVLREPLPVGKAGELLKSPHKPLALAAERYLESEDGAEARALLLALHPGEAVILDARESSDPKHKNKEAWIRWEDRLREDVKTNQADEIFAMLVFHYFDTAPFRSSYNVIVRVRQGKAELCRQADVAREECRRLTERELRSLRDLYEEVSFDDLAPINLPGSGYGGSEGEFIKLDKGGGRRVYASNLDRLSNLLPYKTKKPHIQLATLFGQLSATGEFELRYALKAKIKDLEVIAADDTHPVNYVCKQGDELRALVREKEWGWTETNGERKFEEEVWLWRSLVNNKIGEIADQPGACPILDAQEDMPEEMRKGRPGIERGLWKIRSGKYFVRAGEWKDREGLWLCAPSLEPKLIVEGEYSELLVTPDGNHVVAVRGPRRNSLERIDIRRKQAPKVETDNFGFPITLVPGSGKVIFQRYGEGQSEHLSLDPASGKLEVAKGEFEPLSHQNFRPLQPVAGSREYWAAIPDSEKNLTRVGRYDTRAFSFKTLMEIPEIRFTSESIWIDEAANRIYLAYNGHLLRLPLMIKPDK
jgi:HEAT repeat protein